MVSLTLQIRLGVMRRLFLHQKYPSGLIDDAIIRAMKKRNNLEIVPVERQSSPKGNIVPIKFSYRPTSSFEFKKIYATTEKYYV